uniref:Ubiquitin conjugating enzyme E2 n=1 Tax=Rhizophora mucronata TaxID=61149 RepID=A0A2P2LG73_RHIMU
MGTQKEKKKQQISNWKEGTCAARGRRILLEILELFQDSLRCHPLPINHQKSPERDPPFYLFLDSLRLRGGRE